MADNDIVLDHDYDGIKEYDNPLPNWWLITFFGTIIFAFVYYAHYQLGSGTTLDQELVVEMEKFKVSAPEPSSGPKESEDQLMAIFENPENGKLGSEVYIAKCLACHGDQGQGIVGPNLTDNYWINGRGTRTDIVSTIRVGVPEKGMLAWENLLKKEELLAVASFVYGLKGTQPHSPKAPQGVEVK